MHVLPDLPQSDGGLVTTRGWVVWDLTSLRAALPSHNMTGNGRIMQ